MKNKAQKAAVVILLILFLLGGIVVYQYVKFDDGRLHIVFCDVGQGDGIFMRTPKGIDILLDGGPDNKIVDCVNKYTPFWDRSIELLVLTHPHADHFTGLINISKYYKIKTFITEKLTNNTAGYQLFLQTLSIAGIKTTYVYAGDTFKIKDGTSLKIVGPTKQRLLEVSPNGVIGENGEQASLETMVAYKNFSALLTGDSQATELAETLNFVNSDISVLQIPHHGSKTGVDEELLAKLAPKLAVISVGRNNKYGHPVPSILEMLKNLSIKTLRTDERGDIEIISDGESWRVR